MRLAVSGTACIGKTTLINDMVKTWPAYTANRFNYREKLKEGQHSKSCTQETQWMILNDMIDELQKYSSTDYVIFDRCPLDNLIYSMWAFEHNEGDINAEFIAKCIPLVRESMRLLDIVFFLPITKVAPVGIVSNGTRETDETYIKEIDNLFKALVSQYQHTLEKSVFFPKDDCPGIIEIFGSPLQRIELLKQYLNEKGDLAGSEEESILNPENLEYMSMLVDQQRRANDSEKFEQQQINMLKDFVKSTKSSKRKR